MTEYRNVLIKDDDLKRENKGDDKKILQMYGAEKAYRYLEERGLLNIDPAYEAIVLKEMYAKLFCEE